MKTPRELSEQLLATNITLSGLHAFIEAVQRDAIESFAREVVAKLSDGSKRTHLAHAHFCDAAEEVKALARAQVSPEPHRDLCMCGEWVDQHGIHTSPSHTPVVMREDDTVTSPVNTVDFRGVQLPGPITLVEMKAAHVHDDDCGARGSTCEDYPGAETLQQVPVTACKHEHFTHVYFGEDVCDDCGKSVDDAKCSVCRAATAACEHDWMGQLCRICSKCGAWL